ncbi:MAG: hypothetical protein R2684_11185 [Pyrinomonadaceae bacterium]
MKIKRLLTAAALCVVAFCSHGFAQTGAGFSISRTKEMSKKMKFSPASTLVLDGAPNGSISIESWDKNEAEVVAEITVWANSEEDATRLAAIAGFYVDDSVTSLRVYSVGPNDKNYVKKVDKKLPKSLRSNPFRIDYKVRVPVYTDLRIDGGKGDFSLKGVEGIVSVNYIESNAVISAPGGAMLLTIGSGSVDFSVTHSSWRGQGADIKIAKGDLIFRLPEDANVQIRGNAIGTGTIKIGYENLEPRDRTEFTEKAIEGTAGNGGARFDLTVKEGDLRIVGLRE